MQYSAGSFNTEINSSKSFTNKHKTVIEDLEIMLEKGIPDLTMSEIASRLKISLRTLYEIAPSKDLLIIMMVDNILKKLGKTALEKVSSISSPIEKLETYLKIVNQAVGPKFETLLREALEVNEIENIDVKAFAILLGGIGRDFAKDKNKTQISKSPEDSANSITKSILKGIRLEN